jgi:hypothetical protein
MSLILDGTNGLSDVDGSAATPAIRGSDANTGVFFGADQVGIATNGVERVEFGNSETVFNDGGANVDFRVEGDTDANLLFVDASADNVGIGTSSPTAKFHAKGTATGDVLYRLEPTSNTHASKLLISSSSAGDGGLRYGSGGGNNLDIFSYDAMRFFVGAANISGAVGDERARIDSSGNLFVGKTTANDGSIVGIECAGNGRMLLTRSADWALLINRLVSDGDLVIFQQANITEGSISVSGSTVSYNGGHLSRWAQTTTAKDESLVKGTVLSNLDEMNVYTDAEGNPVQNEQLNKVKVSDVEGDANVAGVFVNWTHDDAHNVDEINMAMTGDMIIRIAEGVTVARGDLLMSAGDGTAKPQGDDIVRSKTIAKVTSTHITCTYADGSFCVPCVLMAC